MAQNGLPTPNKNKATELELIVDSWERRHEWRLLSKTAPRSLMLALLISVAVGAVGYFRFRLQAEQLALIAAGLCALGGILNLLYTLLFPRKLPVRARYFDLEFGLQERISTAFELMHGRIKTHPEIESRQIAEALEHARAIDPKARIAMDFRPRELVGLLLLAMAMLGMILLPTLVGEALFEEAPSAAAEAAREDLREIIETVAKDTDLDDVDRQEILEALQVALERLQEEDISEEEAFAAMSQLQSQLEELENQLEDTIELDQSALEAALEALENFIPPSETDGENVDSAGDLRQPPDDLLDLTETLDQLAQEAAQMSPEEALAAAEALRQAAEELAQMNPELAEQLQSMAEALQEQNTSELQERLAAAQEQLDQEQQQREQNENAQAMLQQQSDRAEEAAEAIAQEQSQEGQQQLADPRQGQAEQSEMGEQRAGQQGDQESDQAQQGANQGDQEAQQNRPGSSENPGRNPDSRSAGAGAGDGAPSNESLPGSAGEDQGADSENDPSGRGEIRYEALYSPSGIGGGGQDEIRLETDASDTTLAEGDFDDNPKGESRVSYDTVFSDYQNAANRALESDYVPLGLRDVVREYFTSLEPGAE